MDPFTLLQAGTAAAGLFRRPKKNAALEQYRALLEQSAQGWDAEAGKIAPQVDAASADADRAYNQRLADLDTGLTPEYRAAMTERQTAPARSAYSAAMSRLGAALPGRGAVGSSVEAGARAALEGRLAASQGAAGAQVAQMDQARRDSSQREKFNLVQSWAENLRRKKLQAQQMADGARSRSASAGSALWQQGRADEADQGQAFGSTAEMLAELLGYAGKKKPGGRGGGMSYRDVGYGPY